MSLPESTARMKAVSDEVLERRTSAPQSREIVLRVGDRTWCGGRLLDLEGTERRGQSYRGPVSRALNALGAVPGDLVVATIRIRKRPGRRPARRRPDGGTP